MPVNLVVVAVMLACSSVVPLPRSGVVQSRMEASMPAIGGIEAPPGTRLLNFDLTDASRAPNAFETYELASTMTPAVFKERYVEAARRAGYKVVVREDGASGIGGGRATFKLSVQAAAEGTSALLTVRRAGRWRA